MTKGYRRGDFGKRVMNKEMREMNKEMREMNKRESGKEIRKT